MMQGNGMGYSDEGAHGGGGYGSGGDWIGAIIGAGAGLYDSHQNRKASKENTDKTIEAQKREAELAYQRSVNMWNMQNQYNSPEAQMNRFLQAGLNPHLIYGQGNPGNAQGFPQYQPADIRYNYAAPKYGAAIASILPTLMAVGTWMQNMRATDVDIEAKKTGMQRTGLESQRLWQLINYLEERNPQVLKDAENKLSLFSFQRDAAEYNAERSFRGLREMEREYEFKWGQPLFDDTGKYGMTTWDKDAVGMRKLEFMQQQAKNRLLSLGEEGARYKNRLLEAQSSWADFDITNPQGLMQLVLSGVMGMAGSSLRLANKPKSTVTHETESRMRGGRSTIRRRKYETR